MLRDKARFSSLVRFVFLHKIMQAKLGIKDDLFSFSVVPITIDTKAWNFYGSYLVFLLKMLWFQNSTFFIS